MIQKNSSKKPWRKRLLISALVLFVVYLCFGIWGVPAIMKSQIQSVGSEALGREVVLEKASFNPLSFEAKLYELRIGPEEGGKEDLLRIGQIALNPQLFASLFGPITVKSVSVEDGEVFVEKDAGGRMSFQDVLDLQSAQPVEGEEASGELPAVIARSVKLEDLQLRFVDSSLATPFEETIRLVEFEGVDLGTVENPGNVSSEGFHWFFDVDIETGNGAKIEIDGGAVSISPWGFKVDVDLENFDFASVQPYIDESVVAKVSGMLDLEVTAEAFLEEEPLIRLAGEIDLESFAVEDESQRYVEFERFGIDGLEVDANRMALTVAEIVLQKPIFSAVLLEDGTPRLPQFKESAPSGAAAPAETAFDFAAEIASVRILDSQVTFEDRSIAEPFRTSVDALNVSLSALKAAQNGGQYDASGKMAVSATVLEGGFELDSELESLAGKASARLKLEELQIAALQNYLAEFTNAEILAGSVNLDIVAESEGLASPRATGSFSMSDLDVNERGSERGLVSMQRLAVDGIALEGEAVTLALVRVENPDLTIWQNEEGMNLQRIIKIEQQAEQAIVEVEQETGVAVTIDTFELSGAGVDFVDTSLLSTYQTRLSRFDLTVNSISTDPEQVADYVFEGTVDGSARVRGDGKLNVSDPYRFMKLDMAFEGYDLLATSPYAETYLGRRLTKGLFLTRSAYEVRDSQLEGTIDLKIDQLTFGEKVKSERALNIPLSLAMGLMKGPDGIIEPPTIKVSGNLDDPSIRIGPLIGQAITNLIFNAVSSPFKFLASIAGGREDLDTVEFEIGVVELSGEGMEKVEALQKIMTERPGLNLEIAFKPEAAEKAFLEDRYLRHLLANPEFKVASGTDLLAAVNEEALESNVRELYLALQPAEADIVAEEVAQVEEPVNTAAEKAEGQEAGVVKRLASLLGLGRKEAAKPAAAAASEIAVADTKAAESAEESPLPSFDEMFEFVAEQRGSIEFDENWLEDLAEQRIQKFKQALLADEAIANDRVFATGLMSDDAKGKTGALSITLAE